MTNEERFIASCESVGETDVRQKLNANGYVGRRAEWASGWLEQVESGKSDATKAEERSSRSRSARPKPYFAYVVAAAVVALLLASVPFFLKHS
jgi:hypothetical protein